MMNSTGKVLTKFDAYQLLILNNNFILVYIITENIFLQKYVDPSLQQYLTTTSYNFKNCLLVF